MARSILISGLGACGKTLISYGLLVKFRKEGLNVTFFKPVTSAGKRIITEEMNVDVDVLAMKKALMLDEELDTLSPCPIPDRYLELHSKREETIPKILKCFEEVSNGKDLVIIEGRSYPEHMMSIGLSDPEVAQALNSKMILLAKYEGDFVVDQLLLYRDFIRERNVEVIGIIFNSVPIEMLRRLNDTVNPYLERMGMSVIGVIPEEARLISGRTDLVRAAREVLRLGPRFAVVKKGEHGVLVAEENGSGVRFTALPAVPLEGVRDPTGAGDCFAGGFMGYLAASGGKDIRGAAARGVVLASFCVEDFSLDRLRRTSPEEIERRLADYRRMLAV